MSERVRNKKEQMEMGEVRLCGNGEESYSEKPHPIKIRYGDAPFVLAAPQRPKGVSEAKEKIT